MAQKEPTSPKRTSIDSANDLDIILNSTAPTYPRKRVAIACEVCRLRKTRCDARRPCGYCKEAGIECIYRNQPSDNRQSSAIEILSRIEERLVRVEAVLSNNGLEPPPALPSPKAQPAINATSPASRSKLSTEDWRRYFQHIISVPYYDTSVKQTAGEAVAARPSLISFQCPFYLDYDTWDDTSQFYDDEFEEEETLNAAIDNLNRRPGFPQLSSTSVWQLQKSFVVNFLNWYPLMEPTAFVNHVEHAKLDGFGERSESNCLVLLGFAVGAISSSDMSSVTSKIEHPYGYYPGLVYYAHARTMLNYLARGSRRNIILLQCRLLVVAYMLFMMRPVLAWDAVTELARDCMHILTSNSLHQMDSQQRENFHRVFWICTTMLHELEAILKTHPIGIRQFHDTVPLPLTSDDTEVYYYFFAQASLRKLLTETLDVVGYRVGQVIYAPVVAAELFKQVTEWRKALPPLVQFQVNTSPVFDMRKAFLRFQFVALHVVIFWPSVLQLLERETAPSPDQVNVSQDRLQALRTEASSCMKHCVLCSELAGDLLMTHHIGHQFALWAEFATFQMLLITYKRFQFIPETNDPSHIRKGYQALFRWNKLKIVRRVLVRTRKQMARLQIPFEDLSIE